MEVSGDVGDKARYPVMRLEDNPTNEPSPVTSIAYDPHSLVEKQIEWAEKMIAGFPKNGVMADQDAQKVVAPDLHAKVDLDEEGMDDDAHVDGFEQPIHLDVREQPIQVVLDDTIRDALDNEIRPALADGRVKPLFHSLSLPKFLDKYHLSSEAVEDGGVDEEREMEFHLDNDNLLDEAVDVINRKGAKLIRDNGMETPWKFSRKQTAFAVEMVNTDAEMLGEGVECTTLKSIPIEINVKDNMASELLTRPESRGVVSDIFRRFAKEADEGGSVAAITGSPGIGKSWTLLYALQQALLYNGATVLFFFQKPKYAVMYLRRNNKIYAWISKSRDKADSVLFQRSDVLVLLDPSEAGAQFATGRMKLLYAASNNEKHFKGDAEKNEGDMRTFLGPPPDKELYVILARLDPKLEKNVIKKRQKDVGNLIRYILMESNFKKRKNLMEENIKVCALKPEELQVALDADGYSNGKTTIPGTLLQVLPKRPEDPRTIGYDGQNIEYRVRVVQAANDEVLSAILKAGREAILSYWAKVSGDERVRWERRWKDCSSTI